VLQPARAIRDALRRDSALNARDLSVGQGDALILRVPAVA